MPAAPIAADPIAASKPFGPVRAWYALGILILLFGLSFVDRLILSLLAPAITAHLHISDTQLGLLFGLGFGVVYALTGLPLAHLIDNRSRVPLVVGGVAIWSLCTIASGFASNFTTLLVLRSGVALGEAVLSPAAISIIADVFPRERRTLPTAVYTGVGSVMYAGAFVVGGAALQLATATSGRLGLEPWRLTLVFVGLPGFLLALLLLLTVREPPRIAEDKSGQYGTLKEVWAYLRKEWLLYGSYFVGLSTVGMINAAKAAWTPTILIRGLGMAPARAGYAYGTVGMVCAILGILTWPTITRLWTARGRKDALVTVFAAAQTMSWISYGVVGLARSPAMLLVAVGFGEFFNAAAVLAPLLIQLATPGRLRARAMALYITALSLVGLGLGPALAAVLSDHLFKGRFAIGSGFALLVFTTGPVATAALWLMHRPYRNALEQAEAREAAG